MIARLGQKFRQVRGGRAIPIAPPPIIGLGTGGGFSYVLQDTGGGTRRRWRRFCAACWSRPTRTRSLNRVFSTFSADHPVGLPRYRS